MDTSRAGEPARYCRAGFFNICMQSFFFFRKIVYLPIGFVRMCDMKIDVRYFIIGLLSLVSSCVNEKEDAGMQPDAVEVGDVLPEFTVVMNDGRVVESGSLQGQPSFILFFNTECGDCRREFPLVQQMYERYGADGRMVLWPSAGIRTR